MRFNTIKERNRIIKAGRKLEDFKPDFKADLHPRFTARKRFFVQKSSIVWCQYDYSSAPDQDGASPNSNRKYQLVMSGSRTNRSI